MRPGRTDHHRRQVDCGLKQLSMQRAAAGGPRGGSVLNPLYFCQRVEARLANAALRRVVVQPWEIGTVIEVGQPRVGNSRRAALHTRRKGSWPLNRAVPGVDDGSCLGFRRNRDGRTPPSVIRSSDSQATGVVSPGVPRVSQGRPLMKTWQYASLLWDRRTVFRRWNQQNQDYLLFIAR